MTDNSLDVLLRRMRSEWCPDTMPTQLMSLLRKESQPNRISKLSQKHQGTGETVLHVAARKHMINTIETVMDCIDSEYNASELLGLQDRLGSTPIHVAARSGDIGVLEAMIKQVKCTISFKILLMIQNRPGNTVLHSAAKSGLKGIIETILGVFTREEAAEILEIRNNFRKTASDCAYDQNIAELLLNYNSRKSMPLDTWYSRSYSKHADDVDDRKTSPKAQRKIDDRTRMLGHIADEEPQLFANLCVCLKPSRMSSLFAENSGEVFHKLLNKCLRSTTESWNNIFGDMWKTFSDETRLSLLLSTDEHSGYNPVRLCIRCNKINLIPTLLANLTTTDREQVICQESQKWFSCIHDGGLSQGIPALIAMFDGLSPDRRIHLMSQDHFWIELGFENPRLLDELFQTNDSALWMKLISSTKKSGCNAIRILVEAKHTKFLNFLLQKLNFEQRREVIEHRKDMEQPEISDQQQEFSQEQQVYSALELSLLHNCETSPTLTETLLTSLNKECVQGVMASFVDKYALLRHLVSTQNKKLLDHYSHAVGPGVMQEKISALLNTDDQTLSRYQLDLLYSYAANYPIPNNQRRAKKVAMVCYNTIQREGALEEAERLEDAFDGLGFLVLKCCWTYFNELLNWITGQLLMLDKEISLLVVCTMSHGFRGHIVGKEGSHGEITNLLHRVHSEISTTTPLVGEGGYGHGHQVVELHVEFQSGLSIGLYLFLRGVMVVLVQACQSQKPSDITSRETGGEADPVVYDPRSKPHITLRRSHTALLLATVADGLAYRGVYTGAIAAELANADGIKDIYAIHLAAAHAVETNPDAPDMTPEYRATLMKPLIMPVASRQH